MKPRSLVASLGLALCLLGSAVAQPAALTPASELKSLVAQVVAKIKEGKNTAADLAPELAAFDALLAKYQDQKTDEVAQIAFIKADLYAKVLKDAERSKSLLLEIKTNFPDSKVAAAVDRMLAGPGKASAGSEVVADIVGKPAPELHFTWSSTPGLKTLSSLKGKVVILDFWATWCGPCIASFPHVRELAAHYQGAEVAIIGVTSIQGRVSNLEARPIDVQGEPEKEMALTPDFIKKHDMTWGVAFSEEKVFNPDYGVRGIPTMVIIAPDGTVRHSMHPMKVETEMIDAVLKEFKLPVPGATKA